jgi:hypothetical protein
MDVEFTIYTLMSGIAVAMGAVQACEIGIVKAHYLTVVCLLLHIARIVGFKSIVSQTL